MLNVQRERSTTAGPVLTSSGPDLTSSGPKLTEPEPALTGPDEAPPSDLKLGVDICLLPTAAEDLSGDGSRRAADGAADGVVVVEEMEMMEWNGNGVVDFDQGPSAERSSEQPSAEAVEAAVAIAESLLGSEVVAGSTASPTAAQGKLYSSSGDESGSETEAASVGSAPASDGGSSGPIP